MFFIFLDVYIYSFVDVELKYFFYLYNKYFEMNWKNDIT